MSLSSLLDEDSIHIQELWSWSTIEMNDLFQDVNYLPWHSESLAVCVISIKWYSHVFIILDISNCQIFRYLVNRVHVGVTPVFRRTEIRKYSSYNSIANDLVLLLSILWNEKFVLSFPGLAICSIQWNFENRYWLIIVSKEDIFTCTNDEVFPSLTCYWTNN